MLKRLYKFLFVDDLLAIPANSAPVSPEPLRKKLMRDLARLTLFAYLLLIFNPVMPLIADKMAHTFWLQYHMVTVHHIYGDAHVDKELTDNAKQAGNDRSAGNIKSASDDYTHIVPAATYSFSATNFISIPYSAYIINHPIAYPGAHYQPPKA